MYGACLSGRKMSEFMLVSLQVTEELCRVRHIQDPTKVCAPRCDSDCIELDDTIYSLIDSVVEYREKELETTVYSVTGINLGKGDTTPMTA